MKNLLVVEDDDTRAQRDRRADRRRRRRRDHRASARARRRSRSSRAKPFDCMVLDLKLPDGSGFQLLERIKKDKRYREPAGDRAHGQGPDATRGDAAQEVRRHDHREGRPLAGAAARRDRRCSSTGSRPGCRPRSGKILEQLHNADAVFEGKKVLIVDDDVRNVFALASVFEGRGMERAVRGERPRGARRR